VRCARGVPSVQRSPLGPALLQSCEGVERGLVVLPVNDYLEDLKRAIERAHKVVATHRKSVAVKEIFRGEKAWEGLVEVFDFEGHPKTAECFAWGVRRENNQGWDVTTMLRIPPVVNPQSAVRIAIAAYARKVLPPRPDEV
jgi:hypothetical protein